MAPTAPTDLATDVRGFIVASASRGFARRSRWIGELVGESIGGSIAFGFVDPISSKKVFSKLSTSSSR